MLPKIDWLSWTIKRTAGEGDNELIVLSQAWDNLCEIYPYSRELLDIGYSWSWGKGRKPFRASHQRSDNGLFIFIHPANEYVLFELTGRGCDALADAVVAPEFLRSIAPYLTRLDLAVDILCDTNPLDFADQRDKGRFRSHSNTVSESGTTCYIGSRDSHRYARVYRYNPPHDRAHLLRVETVVKKEDATATAISILESGLDATAQALGIAFGWTHPLWSWDTPTDVELTAYRPERQQGKTLFWLADVVAALLVRLHREGTINAVDWFGTHVLSKLANDDGEVS